MRLASWIVCLGVLFFVGGCGENSTADADGERAGRSSAAEEGETPIALDQLPTAVRAAAEKAVPGIHLTGAERETEDGKTVYEVAGTVNGASVEIELTAAGKVVEIDDGSADDDDDAGHGEDDDDDDAGSADDDEDDGGDDDDDDAGSADDDEDDGGDDDDK